MLILGEVRINLKKKLILYVIFGLAIFAMGITIIRGSIFGGVYKSASVGLDLNITWI